MEQHPASGIRQSELGLPSYRNDRTVELVLLVDAPQIRTGF